MHPTKKRILGYTLHTAIALACLLGLFTNLSTVPAVFWDEGWTLTVARTWLQTGYYGALSAGNPAPAGLTASFPIVLPIALSFRVLGIGVWQGRLVIALYTLAALLMLYLLTRALYDRNIALATLLVALLLSSHRGLQPLVLGRQVMGELPAVFFLLAGFVSFRWTARRSLLLAFLPVICWALALHAKAQVLPFWLLSVFAAMALAIRSRNVRLVTLFGMVIFGTIVAAHGFGAFASNVLLSDAVRPQSQEGIYRVTAVVLVSQVRLLALLLVLLYGLPWLIALAHNFRRAFSLICASREYSLDEILRVAILVLAGAWVVWYVLFAELFVRYLFPGVFIGSMFVAVALRDLTEFNPGRTFRSAARIFRADKESLVAAVVVLLVCAILPGTLVMLYSEHVDTGGRHIYDVASFMNSATSGSAVIESYESELLFLLDRPYHYPPDRVFAEVFEQSVHNQKISTNYDPLAADPDYLVVGPFARTWRLYDAVLASGKFNLLRSIGPYSVYRRVRSAEYVPHIGSYHARFIQYCGM